MPPTAPSPAFSSSISAKCGTADLEKETANCTSLNLPWSSQAPAIREGNDRFLRMEKNEKRTAGTPEENKERPRSRGEARRETNSSLLKGEEQAKDKTHMEKGIRRTNPLKTVQRHSSGLQPSSASPRDEAKRVPLFQQTEKARKERGVETNGKTQPWKRMQQWEEEWKRQKSWREKKLLLTEKKERSEVARPSERAERLWSATSQKKQGERDRQSTPSGRGDATAVDSHTRAPWGVLTPRSGLLEKGARAIQAPAETNEKDEEQGDPEGGRAARTDRGESETNSWASAEKSKGSARDDQKESQLADEGRRQVINGDAGEVETEDAEDKENSQAFLNGRRRGQNDANDVIPFSLSSTSLVENNSQKKEESWTHPPSKKTHASAFSSSYIKMALESESALRPPPAIAASLLAPFQWTDVFSSHLKCESPPPDSLNRHGEKPLSSNRDTEMASHCSPGSGRRSWRAAGAARMQLPSPVFSEAGPSWGVHTPQRSGGPREASRARQGSKILRTVKKRDKKAEEGMQHSLPSRKARRVKSRGSRARKRERRCSACSTGVARREEAADRFIAGLAKKDLKKAAEKAQRLERRLEALLQFAQCLREKAPQLLWPGVFEETRVLSTCSQTEGYRGRGAGEAAASSAAFSGSPAGAGPHSSISEREERTAGQDSGTSDDVHPGASASGVGSRGAANGEEEKGEGGDGVAEGEDDTENYGCLERKRKDETSVRTNGRRAPKTQAGGRDLQGGGVYVHPKGTEAAADRDAVFESPQHRALSASAQERIETPKKRTCVFGEKEEASEPREMPEGVPRLTCGLAGTSRTPRIERDTVPRSLRPRDETPHSSSLTPSPCFRTRQETEYAQASLHASPGATPVPPMAEMGRKSLLAFHGDPPVGIACRNDTADGEAGQTEAEADSNSPSSFLSSSSSLLWEAVEQCVVSLDRRETRQYEALLKEGEACVRKATFSGDRAPQLRAWHAYARGGPLEGEPSSVCVEAKFRGRTLSGRLEPPPLGTSFFEGNIGGRVSTKDAHSRPWWCGGKSENGRPNEAKREESLMPTSGVLEDTPAEEKLGRGTLKVPCISGVRTPEFGGADGTDASVGTLGFPETQRRARLEEKKFGKDEKAGAAEGGLPFLTPRLGFSGTSANVSENKSQSRSLKRRDVVSALACESPNPVFIHEVPATEIREIFAFRQKLTATLLSREPLLRRQLRARVKPRSQAEETERRTSGETDREGSHVSALSCGRHREGYDADKDEESRENDLFRRHGSWSIREQLAEELLQELLKEGAVDEIDDLASQMVKILVNEEGIRALALAC
ncbi:UNVERIFIED_CONTAM: hypothetical protein HHA_259155 [Hammondia hammondi]|eukprot:XP_008883093.1 hypothetical protein HHA_259155 [Hammondia hammondi]